MIADTDMIWIALLVAVVGIIGGCLWRVYAGRGPGYR
jgi:hypothetical protein